MDRSLESIMQVSWVVVVDRADEPSRRQFEVCQALRAEGRLPPSLKGLIDCADPHNADAPVCETVELFPAFCHVPTNSCVYGLRETYDSLAELETIVSGGDGGGAAPPAAPAAPPQSNQ